VSVEILDRHFVVAHAGRDELLELVGRDAGKDANAA
jgi:hypothetical protein